MDGIVNKIKSWDDKVRVVEGIGGSFICLFFSYRRLPTRLSCPVLNRDVEEEEEEEEGRMP